MRDTCYGDLLLCGMRFIFDLSISVTEPAVDISLIQPPRAISTVIQCDTPGYEDGEPEDESNRCRFTISILNCDSTRIIHPLGMLRASREIWTEIRFFVACPGIIVGS